VDDGDHISWMKGMLKEKALRWHQARTQQFADLNVQDTWIAYRQSADEQFSNEHELTEASQTMRDLRYKRDMSDYLVTLKNPNRGVDSAGQACLDQIRLRIPNGIGDMIFMLGPNPTDDVEFLGV
jgi:hypothetical protein